MWYSFYQGLSLWRWESLIIECRWKLFDHKSIGFEWLQLRQACPSVQVSCVDQNKKHMALLALFISIVIWRHVRFHCFKQAHYWASGTSWPLQIGHFHEENWSFMDITLKQNRYSLSMVKFGIFWSECNELSMSVSLQIIVIWW